MASDSDLEDLLLVNIGFSLVEEEELLLLNGFKRKRKHRRWVREWITEKELAECNTAYKLQKRLLECDHTEFGRMLRMTPQAFDFILTEITDEIRREDTNFRLSITPQERLSLTLKYLGTGESSASLSESYRVGRCTVGRIIKDTCKAIFKILGPRYIKTPSCAQEWLEVVNSFDQRWNYPGCLGAVDGKHVRLMKPWRSGSNFYNYKKFFSVLMLAIVNSNYEIIYVNVGAEGKCGDATIWRQSDFLESLEDGSLDLPNEVDLKGTNLKVPCHFVGDDAFPLTTRLLKPYSKRFLTDEEAIFNYRLSRSRNLVENVFGIIASKFRVLRHLIEMNPESATDVILAICTLHNILREHCGASYFPPGCVDHEDNNFVIQNGAWRKEKGNNLEDYHGTHHRNCTERAKKLRDDLAEYFVSDAGKVGWQRRCITNTLENVQRNMDYLRF